MGRNRTSPTATAIDTMHKTDQYVGALSTWKTGTSQIPLDNEKDYFCVATWGTMHILKFPKFIWHTSKIGPELHNSHGKHLVGETRQVSIWGVSDIRIETFTVWHDREFMAAFYKSGAHLNAMRSMKDDTDFRARRVWVKGGDIPISRDSAATKEFVLRVKRGDFPEAPKNA